MTPAPPDLRPISPPVEYADRLAQIWWIAGGVLLLLVLTVLVWYFMRRRRRARPEARLSPSAFALERLNAIRQRQHEMDARTFGNEICDALRVFVDGQYCLRAESQTSPEFLAAISKSHLFAPGEQALLAEFLERCDLLKFAREAATPAAKEGLLAQAFDFVEHSQAPAAQPPPLPPDLGSPPPVASARLNELAPR